MAGEKRSFCILQGLKGFFFRYSNLYAIALLSLCALLFYGCEASVKVKWPKSDAFDDRTVVSKESRT